MSQVKAHDPRALAARQWALYNWRSPCKLVLEDLALAMGVAIIEGPLVAAEARLVRKGPRGLIRVKESLPEQGRKRFAMAHEIGHWLLHPDVDQFTACTSEDMLSSYRTSAPEIQANEFAAELLMPTHLFREDIRRTVLSGQTIRAMASIYQTTLTATAVRYVELSDGYCAMVVMEDGVIRWWRTSQAMNGLWLKPGSKAPEGSIAWYVLKGEAPPEAPEELEFRVWLDLDDQRNRQWRASTAMEDLIILRRYNTVISLLWL